MINGWDCWKIINQTDISLSDLAIITLDSSELIEGTNRISQSILSGATINIEYTSTGIDITN